MKYNETIDILENFTKICNVLYKNNRIEDIEKIETLVNDLNIFDFRFEFESLQDYNSNMNS